MEFTYHARTDTGLVRTLNEDSIRTIQPEDEKLQATRGELLIVADGMGGHQSGEVASRQSADTVSQRYYELTGGPAAALVQAIRDANAAVFRRAQKENRQGMGTTVVAAARVGEKLYIAHVGDSRLYLIRDGGIQRLTEDHSLVAEQVAAGVITEEEAERHPYRNVISRAVGTTPEVEVELARLSPLPLQEGDVIVLCSDGLTEHVKPRRILQLVQNRTPEEATKVLIDAAKAGGGSDNISVIMARVGAMPAPDAQTTPLAATALDDEPTTRQFTVPDSAPAPPDPHPEPRRGPSAFWAVLASLLVLALVVGGGFYALSLLNNNSVPVAATATPPSNLLPSPTTAATRTVRLTPTARPRPTETIATSGTLTETNTLSDTETVTDTVPVEATLTVSP